MQVSSSLSTRRRQQGSAAMLSKSDSKTVCKCSMTKQRHDPLSGNFDSSSTGTVDSYFWRQGRKSGKRCGVPCSRDRYKVSRFLPCTYTFLCCLLLPPVSCFLPFSSCISAQRLSPLSCLHTPRYSLFLSLNCSLLSLSTLTPTIHSVFTGSRHTDDL